MQNVDSETGSSVRRSRGLARSLPAAVLALTACWSSPAVSGQAVANAKMHGTVTDTTGAIVPGATVEATRLDTGAVSRAAATEAGDFTLPNLPVGS